MLATVFYEHGGPDVLRYEEVPTPVPGPGEVLVRVHAGTVNRGPDTRVRQDGFGIPAFRLPHVTGADAAGVIAACGPGVQGWEPGSRVVVYPVMWCGECDFCRRGAGANYCRNWRMVGMHAWGGHAEFVKVPARNLVALPDGVGFEEAATLPVSYITAYHGLLQQVRLEPGETVLVMAAGSGIGAAAIQIAKHHGARVVATTGAEWKVARAREIGADVVVQYTQSDWAEQVRAATEGKGVDVVFDNVGAETWAGSLSTLGRAGRVLCSGNTGGAVVPLDLRTLYRNMIEMRFHMQGALADLEALVGLVADGSLRPVIDTRLAMSESAAAQERLATQSQFGKVVLVPDALLSPLASNGRSSHHEEH
jgi:NADPH:quinone reductase-like Zn-dependent oxidoreductase